MSHKQDPLKRKEWNRIYRKSPKRKEYMRKYHLAHYPRKNIIEFLGNKCVRCGFTDIRALQLDHIFGGGTKEFKKFTGQMYIFYSRNLEEAKKRLQVLCANCNWIKRYENNENIQSSRNNCE